MPYGLDKFVRYAVNIWCVNPQGKSKEEIANEGLNNMQAWMTEIGLIMNLSDLNVTEDMLDGITKSTVIMDGGYKILNATEIKNILKESL